MSFLDLRLKEQKGLPFLGVFPIATRERNPCKRLRLLSRSVKVPAMDRCLLSSFAGRKRSMERSDCVAAEVKQRFVPTYWIIGFFVFANTMICYFDRVNFSVAAPTIMRLFHWDMGVLGLAMSMFGVGYILTQIPA